MLHFSRTDSNERHNLRRNPVAMSRRELLLGAGSALLLAAVSWSRPADAGSIDMDTRLALQDALRDYIDGKSATGGYSYFDETTGEAVPLSLKKIHALLFRKADRYMLCADFLNANGEDVVIDYIFAPHADGYVLEKEIEGRRSILVQLFERLL